MQKLFRLKSWDLVFSNTPILQNSSTPIPRAMFTGKTTELQPDHKNRVFLVEIVPQIFSPHS